jgi:protein-disulfide isomerase
MNKSLITGGAVVAVCAVVGYTALGFATRGDDIAEQQPKPAAVGVQVADASGDAEILANADPSKPFAGSITESGGFTGDVVEGAAESPVTIIEYASLTCPHCATFHKTIYNEMKEDYIDSEKVTFIFRDFPLDNIALAASVIARCGGEKRYPGLVDLFLERQNDWRTAQNPLDELKRLARLGGLGSEQIDACMSDQTLGQSIIDRARIGQDVFQVRATPTILVNGEKFDGDMTLENLTASIDEMLAE